MAGDENCQNLALGGGELSMSEDRGGPGGRGAPGAAAAEADA